MGHHLSGMSNSAKRRAAMAEEVAVSQEDTGMLPMISRIGNDAWHAVQSSVGGLCSMSKEKALEVEHVVEEKIQHRPITSVVAALGVGAILGAMCAMWCRRD